jgi:histidinol dehydrogenase
MLHLQATHNLAEVHEFLNQRKESRRDVAGQVAEVGRHIRERGWEGIAEFTERFDGVRKEPRPEAFRVSEKDYEAASGRLDAELTGAIELAIRRVRTFHEKQKRQDWFQEEPGIRTGQLFRPLESAGVYAPGGAAVLFSTLFMNVIPAQVAGCPSIVVCSPPQRGSGTVDALILAVCRLLGIEAHQIWAIGGAQAIFSMAAELPGFPAVHGIFGPGNAYVMEAKRQVQGDVRIESLPGHSEILVIADDTADPRFVAADLLSQAEHAGGEMSILVSASPALLEAVEREVEKQLEGLLRKEIAASSLLTGGALIQARNLDQACEIANLVAPEHLEIQTRDPASLLDKIRHAGAVFVGPWSTEPIGDYTAGTNHVLPTGGAARFSSALSVDDFMKKISVVEISREGLSTIGPAAMKLAEAEGLQGHREAIAVRLADGG